MTENMSGYPNQPGYSGQPGYPPQQGYGYPPPGQPGQPGYPGGPPPNYAPQSGMQEPYPQAIHNTTVYQQGVPQQGPTTVIIQEDPNVARQQAQAQADSDCCCWTCLWTYICCCLMSD
ncbi:unnamed protein product [Owenia fusiformis]|uniref:Uncharacterized protein n=1 Tax=Owenia fusiformis TaxID=6347 RepID=A0A8S4PKC7_OWEFU|nr:unnamed protein product [Owenia fusiformis]